jgi:xylulokinase
VRTPYETSYHGVRVEIDPDDLWAAIVASVTGLRPGRVDLIGLTALGPAFVAMDRSGKPLTPLVTHADRRSVAQARQIEREFGRDRHLATAGNRPYPGRHRVDDLAVVRRARARLLKAADLVGCLPTWLHRRLTGERVIDPSQASFLGVFRTTTLDGWDPDLVAAAGGRMEQLPEVHEADRVAGTLTAKAAKELGLPDGVPVLSGCLDGSAAMLAAAVAEDEANASDIKIPPGLLVNSVGSTDVLAMAVDAPRPVPRLLTRALGVGRNWVAVATLASVGTTIEWAHRTLFPDLEPDEFHRLLGTEGTEQTDHGVRFRPYLSGDRTTLNQPARRVLRDHPRHHPRGTCSPPS